MRRGDAFIAMHWGSRYTSGAGINALTVPAFDPHSKQPELKHAAVSVERFDAAWRSVMLRAVDTPDEAVRLQQEIAPLLQRFDYAAVALSESERVVVSVELASAAAPAADHIEVLDQLFGLAQQGELLLYRDAARGVERRARISADALVALRLTGEPDGRGALKQAVLTASASHGCGCAAAPMAELAGLPQARGRAFAAV